MWKFKPILKQRVWGGSRIATFKGCAPLSSLPIGESYELSGMPGTESIVEGGVDDGKTLNTLITAAPEALLGKSNLERTGLQFPLLVKILDAREDLSIQVHPDDSTAPLFALPNGKSELWYTLQADKDARICAGFKTDISPQEYREAVAEGSIAQKLNYMSAKPGDVFYIPGGTVHSLCKGSLVLEIQQPSETTFRIYDYGRRDLDGNLRELHTCQALQALNLTVGPCGRILYPDERETPSGLLSTRHFTVNRLHLSYRHHRDYKDVDSFKVLAVVSGAVDITDSAGTITASQGTVLLVAAQERNVTLTPHGTAIIIETYI